MIRIIIILLLAAFYAKNVLAVSLSEALLQAYKNNPELNAERENIEIIFKHWQKMALYSLKNAIPDNTWRQVSVEDWDKAMKILSAIEQGAEVKNEN